MPLPIEDYAVVGDTRTAAVIGNDGSVDWLCLPRFDSPACFAALLGTPEHGRWLIGPETDPEHGTDDVSVTRRYLDDSSMLETTWTTPTGTVRINDIMPLNDDRADLVRRVTGVSGTVVMRHEWVVRTWYGKIRPWVTRRRVGDTEVITAVAGPDTFVLRGDRLPHAVDGRHLDRFEVGEGDTLTFSTTWIPSHHDVPDLLPFDDRIEETMQRAHAWAERCTYEGPYREAVIRSLLTLRGMTHSETGGIVAAPTTSLPEDFGGSRNWDYRYCWLRDASLTLEALLAAGYQDEADEWRTWLLRAVAGDPADFQIMYAVDGARDLPERELDHLPGYEGSRPVRIGNGAVAQRQVDVLGEVMTALADLRHVGDGDTESSWSLQRALVDDLASHWDQPDRGIWEIRGPERRFTHSRVMVWVALDRAIEAVEVYGLEGPADEWREVRDAVRDEVMSAGYDAERNTFTQHDKTTEVDASLLLVGLVGFLEPDDPKVLGTIDAVMEDLMVSGLLLRYRTESGVDGLEGREHPFIACSFWLVSALAAAGRTDEAHEVMRRLLDLRNDVGLLSEEYDVENQRMAGNFPQAFSHLTLVGAAIQLAEADAEQRGDEPPVRSKRAGGV